MVLVYLLCGARRSFMRGVVTPPSSTHSLRLRRRYALTSLYSLSQAFSASEIASSSAKAFIRMKPAFTSNNPNSISLQDRRPISLSFFEHDIGGECEGGGSQAPGQVGTSTTRTERWTVMNAVITTEVSTTSICISPCVNGSSFIPSHP